MKNYTSIKKTVVVILTLLPLMFFVSAGGSDSAGDNFSWSMGLQNVRSGEMVPFSAPVAASTGEQFRLVISSEAECFAYVIYESPDGNDVLVLHSGAMQKGEIWRSGVFQLTEPKGSESLFVLVSRNEQRTLAQRISAMGNNPTASQRRAVMNEVFRIRSDVSKTREAPEKPVLMGGAARGQEDRNQGVEFSGSAAYVKTISIEH